MVRLGLFLIRVVVWASEQLSRQRQGPRDYVLAGAAYVGLAGVTVIGRVVDGVSSITISSRQGGGGRADSAGRLPQTATHSA
jgi:hypothetical protein